MRVPAQPDLYRANGDAPTLLGSRCAECGRVSFPALTIGCDVCGAAEEPLKGVELVAAGLLHSIVTVHRHQGEPRAPFSVAEIRLDDGPLIRAMVAPDASGLRIGDRVSGTWRLIRLDSEGDEVVEPVFVRAAK